MKFPETSTELFGRVPQGAPPLDWRAGIVDGTGRRGLVAFGIAALSIAVLVAASLPWEPISSKRGAQPLAGTQPLDGNWSCSLAGEPIGTLSVEGWDYALGSNDGVGQASGALEVVILWSKHHEEVIRVQSGDLRDRFGVKLGYHYKVADQPEMLVFNIGPGSGIRCSPK